MSKTGVREVEHEITVAAPATEVYRLIAQVSQWPRIYPPTIYVHQLEPGDREERIRIWATANGEAKTWTSHRTLDPVRMRIGFRQEVSSPPVAAMSGTWIIEPTSEAASRVRLLHAFRAVDDDEKGLAWIDEAVDRNSRSELAGLKRSVEQVAGAGEALFSFEDSVRIDGSAEDAYAFVNDAQLWPKRLPHVESTVLTEDVPGLQCLEMVTRAPNGSAHTTKSYRVCFPHRRIVYKQVTMPALMSLHTGCWTFSQDDLGAIATSQHTVLLNTENIKPLMGERATEADAREHVRQALSANSRATLGLAAQYAESRR